MVWGIVKAKQPCHKLRQTRLHLRLQKKKIEINNDVLAAQDLKKTDEEEKNHDENEILPFFRQNEIRHCHNVFKVIKKVFHQDRILSEVLLEKKKCVTCSKNNWKKQKMTLAEFDEQIDDVHKKIPLLFQK